MRSIGLPEFIILAIIVAIVVVLFKGLRNLNRTGSGNASVIGLGALLGGLVGFLLRPSVPLIGQLPFLVVISRGSGLRGLDALLRATAEQSYNYMVAGGVLGAIALAVWRGLARRSPATPPASPISDAPAAPTPSAPSVRYCTSCGAALTERAAFCPACGTRRAGASTAAAYCAAASSTSTSAAGSGSFSFSPSMASTMTSATAKLRNHFLLAGITYHGAHSVLHRLMASS